MKKQIQKQKTFYSLDVKNPYCSKGEFLWKHNDDSDLGEEFINRRFPKEQDESYKGEWRARFRGGNPEAFMDKESKKIFHKLKKEKGI